MFAHLPLLDGATVNDSLTQGGFRRSQNIAYRPACEQCSACVSARIPVTAYDFSRSERRVLLLHSISTAARQVAYPRYRLMKNRLERYCFYHR